MSYPTRDEIIEMATAQLAEMEALNVGDDTPRSWHLGSELYDDAKKARFVAEIKTCLDFIRNADDHTIRCAPREARQSVVADYWNRD